MQNRAFDPVPMAQHRGGVARAPFAQCIADIGGGDRAQIALHDLRNGHLEPVSRAEILQRLSRSLATFAKTEIRAHHHMRQAQALGQHIAGKLFRLQARQRMVEGQFIKKVDAELFQPMRAGFGIHQTEGGAVACEELARMWLKGQDAQRRVMGARDVDHMLMAQMHTVEIADGDAGTPIFGRDILIIAHGPHGDRISRAAREGQAGLVNRK